MDRDETESMSLWELYSWLGARDSKMEVAIQLPDNEPPVSFVAEVVNNTVVLFPIPPHKGAAWDHDTNRITFSPLTPKNGRKDGG